MATLENLRHLPKPQRPQLVEARLKTFLHRRLRDNLDRLKLHDQQDTPIFKRTLHALELVGEGKDGLCEGCAEPIEIARLLDDPACELCESCELGMDCSIELPTPSTQLPLRTN